MKFPHRKFYNSWNTSLSYKLWEAIYDRMSNVAGSHLFRYYCRMDRIPCSNGNVISSPSLLFIFPSFSTSAFLVHIFICPNFSIQMPYFAQALRYVKEVLFRRGTYHLQEFLGNMVLPEEIGSEVIFFHNPQELRISEEYPCGNDDLDGG